MAKARDLKKLIIKAARAGDSGAVHALLTHDRTLLNARDADGSTPLHCAAWKGHAHIVTLLLTAGADVNARSDNDHYGDTPLHAAAHGNQRAVAEILISHGADIHAVNPAGRTPLAETEIHKAAAVARLLREHGAG
jgi:ankyrin repeat protein